MTSQGIYSYVETIENEIYLAFTKTDLTSTTKKQIVPRLASLALVPISYIASCVDTCIGLGALTADLAIPNSYLTSELARDLPKFCSYAKNAKYSLASPYKNFVGAINTKAPFDHDPQKTNFFPTNRMLTATKNCLTSQNKFVKHIKSRIAIAYGGILGTISVLFSATVAVPSAALSLLALGNCKSLNSIAYSELQNVGMLPVYLFSTIIGVINPTYVAFKMQNHLG